MTPPTISTLFWVIFESVTLRFVCECESTDAETRRGDEDVGVVVVVVVVVVVDLLRSDR